MTDIVQGAPGTTPGPWSFKEAFGPYKCSLGDNDVSGAEINVPEPDLSNGWRDAAIQVWGPEAEANAHQIAASPLMYAALQAYADAYEAGTGTIHVNKQVRAALAAARGEVV